MTDAAERVRAHCPEPIRLGLILGSGLGVMAEELEEATRFAYADLPGFPVSGVTGHAGALSLGHLAGAPVAIFSGRAHYYEGGDAAAMRAPLETLKALGAGAVLLTNAAGSTREATPPAALMAVTDHIAWSGLNPLIGERGDERFVDMTDAYDPMLRARLKEAASREGVALAEGVYAWFSGPSFETPAEIAAVRMLGADAVGMSTVPETILARRLGLRVAALSVITNYAAGMSATPLTHDETQRAAARAEADIRRLICAFAAGFA